MHGGAAGRMSGGKDTRAGQPVLLHSKLVPPKTFNKVLDRPQLIEQLGEERVARVNLVLGPAGFGKSTVLRQAWATRRRDRTAWLTLDEGDNDPGRFLFHLLAALGHGLESPVLPEPVFASVAVNADQFSALQGTMGELPEGFCLFVDELDMLREPAALDILRGVIQSLPYHASIVMGGRAVPDLPLGRLRMHGQLQVIDADALRFSCAEIEAILRDELPADDLIPRLAERLFEVTEGWIGSIQMAILSLRSCGNREDFLVQFTGSNTELAEYLAEDLLARQPHRIQEFLLDSSAFDHLAPALCDFVLERKDSEELLQSLSRANMFLFSYEGEASWFRYHNLFRGFLLGRAASRNPERLAALRRRAALWFADRDRPSAAIGYALAAGDSELAARLIDDAIMSFFVAGRLPTIVDWVRPLPEHIRDRFPRIMVAYAWSLLALQQAPRTVAALVADLEGRNDLDEDLRNEVVYLGPYHKALRDQLATLDEDCLAVMAANPGMTPFARGILWNIVAYTRMHGKNLEGAAEAAREARKAHVRSGSIYGLGFAECFASQVELLQGRMKSAQALCESAVAIARSGARETATTATTASLSIRLHFLRGEAEPLTEAIDSFGSLIVQLGTPHEVIEHYLILASLAFDSGSYTEACRVLNELRRQGRARSHRRMAASAWALQAQFAARAGDLAAARDYLRQARECEELATYGGFLLECSEAVVALAAGETEEARAVLDAALRETERTGFALAALELRTLRVELAQTTGASAAAEADIRAILHLAERESIVRPLMGAPDAVRRALAVAARPGSGLDAMLEQPEESTRDDTGPDIAEPLSRRELEVLELVSAGLSNQSVADQLYISLPTVKTHLRNVNAKLFAANRTEAVAIARHRGLIDRN